MPALKPLVLKPAPGVVLPSNDGPRSSATESDTSAVAKELRFVKKTNLHEKIKHVERQMAGLTKNMVKLSKRRDKYMAEFVALGDEPFPEPTSAGALEPSESVE